MCAIFVEQVLANCVAFPERMALLSAQTSDCISWASLYRHISGARELLEASGIKKGDTVVIAASSSFDFIFIYLALQSVGAIAVPLDAKTPLERFEDICQRVDPVLRIWPDALMPNSFSPEMFSAESENAIPVNANLEDVADIMFTSGTTGIPKGVILTHANISAAARNINSYIGNSMRDIELCPMPLSHSFGIARIRCNLLAGGCLILADGVTKPKMLFEAIKKFHVTGLSMVGPAWNMLHKLTGEKLGDFASQLRYFELGSAAILPEAKRELAALLPDTKICMHYGLTEASRAAFLDFHKDYAAIDSVGNASPLCEIAVFSDTGEKLAPGEDGEVCIKGEIVCKGYLDQQHNMGAFYPDGYFRTGDLGHLDSNGYLYLKGRLKEMINVGGEKVGPLEVESLIDNMEGVEESGCVGIPDSILGERVAVFIVPANDCPPDLKAVTEFLKDRLEPYKLPVRLVLIENLPRTVSGKVKRAALKNLLQ